MAQFFRRELIMELYIIVNKYFSRESNNGALWIIEIFSYLRSSFKKNQLIGSITKFSASLIDYQVIYNDYSVHV